MELIAIGDLYLEGTAGGRLLRLTIATQEPTTTLAVEGVMVLQASLAAWLAEHAATTGGAPQEVSHA